MPAGSSRACVSCSSRRGLMRRARSHRSFDRRRVLRVDPSDHRGKGLARSAGRLEARAASRAGAGRSQVRARRRGVASVPAGRRRREPRPRRGRDHPPRPRGARARDRARAAVPGARGELGFVDDFLALLRGAHWVGSARRPRSSACRGRSARPRSSPPRSMTRSRRFGSARRKRWGSSADGPPSFLS